MGDHIAVRVARQARGLEQDEVWVARNPGRGGVDRIAAGQLAIIAAVGVHDDDVGRTILGMLRAQQLAAVGTQPEVFQKQVLPVQQALFCVLRQVVFEQAADAVVLQEVQQSVVRRELRRSRLDPHSVASIAQVSTRE